MTMQEFVRDVILPSLGGEKPKACYIAVMEPMDTDTWQLEVETDNGVIGGTWDTGIKQGKNGHQKASEQANRLERELETVGFKVYEDRESWEESWGEDDE